MIENDNENKLARKKMDQWLKIRLDLFGRIWDLNFEQWNIFFYKNFNIVKKSQISEENSPKQGG